MNVLREEFLDEVPVQELLPERKSGVTPRGSCNPEMLYSTLPNARN
jgi:hypothetical protein